MAALTPSRPPDSGSIVGNTVLFRHAEQAAEPFTVDSISLAVDGPSGATTPTVSPATATGALMEFEALTVEAAVGDYALTWSIHTGGQTVVRRERYFVTWTDLYQSVRGLLRVGPETVADSDVDFGAATVLQTLRLVGASAPATEIYASLPLVDRVTFDRALALLTAAWMRPFVPKEDALTEVVSYATGTDKWQWADPASEDGQRSVERVWMDKALELLMATQTLGVQMRSFQADARTFQAAGRRRNKVSPFTSDGLGGVRLNPFFRAFDEWLDCGYAASWSWLGTGR